MSQPQNKTYKGRKKERVGVKKEKGRNKSEKRTINEPRQKKIKVKREADAPKRRGWRELTWVIMAKLCAVCGKHVERKVFSYQERSVCSMHSW